MQKDRQPRKVERRKVEFGVHRRCPKCKGKGEVPNGNHEPTTCFICDGWGYVEDRR